MKFIKFYITILLFASSFYACKKVTAVSSNVSNADAATMLAGSMASSSYGFNNISNDISLNAVVSINSNMGCAVSKIDTFVRVSSPGLAYSYNYKLIYNHKLNCNTNNIPDNITGILSYMGSFKNSSASLANSGTTTYSIAGLVPTATSYTLNAEYKSNGTFKLKSDTTNTGSANVDILLKNVIINKATQVISGGTATAIITGATIKKGDFTYNGTVTFNGNSMATLALNGSNYSINLVTGVVVSK